MPVPFTFFGDLLGICDAYKKNPNEAHKKLSDFYDIVYNHFHDICKKKHQLHVMLYSDTIAIRGKDCALVVPRLAKVYGALLQNGTLLRGGLADHYLEFEPRIQKEGLKKSLPTSDVLVRATVFQKCLKGARCGVEPALAKKLLIDHPTLLTEQGVAEAAKRGETRLPSEDLWMLSIAPVPAHSCHEMLYLLLGAHDHSQLESIRRRLADMKRDSAPAVAEHYDQTIMLIDRSVERRKMVGDISDATT